MSPYLAIEVSVLKRPISLPHVTLSVSATSRSFVGLVQCHRGFGKKCTYYDYQGAKNLLLEQIIAIETYRALVFSYFLVVEFYAYMLVTSITSGI